MPVLSSSYFFVLISTREMECVSSNTVSLPSGLGNLNSMQKHLQNIPEILHQLYQTLAATDIAMYYNTVAVLTFMSVAVSTAIKCFISFGNRIALCSQSTQPVTHLP